MQKVERGYIGFSDNAVFFTTVSNLSNEAIKAVSSKDRKMLGNGSGIATLLGPFGTLLIGFVITGLSLAMVFKAGKAIFTIVSRKF